MDTAHPSWCAWCGASIQCGYDGDHLQFCDDECERKHCDYQADQQYVRTTFHPLGDDDEEAPKGD